MKDQIKQMVRYALEGNAVRLKETTRGVLNTKIRSALETKQVDVAKNLFKK